MPINRTWAGRAVLLAIWLRFAVARALLAVALACQDRFDSLLLTWFQIESVPLNFLNDFLLQTLRLKRRSATHGEPDAGVLLRKRLYHLAVAAELS
jgi:hypothetical protein